MPLNQLRSTDPTEGAEPAVSKDGLGTTGSRFLGTGTSVCLGSSIDQSFSDATLWSTASFFKTQVKLCILAPPKVAPFGSAFLISFRVEL